MPQTTAVRVGCQEPRLLVAPPSVSSEAGLELIDLCESVGMQFLPAQKLALVEICAEAGPGKWSAMQTLVEVCRQNGKGLIVEALQLGDLFLFDSYLSTYSAHKFSTAEEQAQRLFFWIENCDDLRKRCRKPLIANGKLGVRTLKGHRVKFVARERDNGRGLTGDRVVLDEALILKQVVLGSLVPTLSAVPNPQINMFSSTGFGVEESDSDVMWNFRAKQLVKALTALGLPLEEPDELTARGIPGAHVYLDWSAVPDAARRDPYAEEHLARANFAYGYHLNAQYIDEVEKEAMTEAQYLQERLGVWPISRKLVTDEADSLLELWRQRVWPSSKLGARREWGVDVSPEQKSASVWVAGESSAGGTHVECVAHGPGTGWLVERVGELVAKHGGRVAVEPSGPVRAVLGELEVAFGDGLVKLTGPQWAGACDGFLAGVKADGRVRVRVPSEFEGAVASSIAGAVKANAGDGGFTWSRRSSAVDISPLVAATLAHHLAGVPAVDERPVFAY